MKLIPILALSIFCFFKNTIVKELHLKNSTLIVNVLNVKHREGNIKAVLQDKNSFLTPQFISCVEVVPTTDEVQMIFNNLPLGDYSVAIYHDLNGNNLFDRNWFGYPSEPFAVSNNLHPYKLLSPSFDDAKISLTESTKTLHINLLNN
jgi:uncharacterized protein (DUF2141 family)